MITPPARRNSSNAAASPRASTGGACEGAGTGLRASAAGFLPWLRDLLALPVSGTSLAVFRISVGLVMALEAYALLVPHDAAITSGVPLDHYYAGRDIKFHFPYEGLEWLPLAPRSVMYALTWLLTLAGVTMAAGFLYRWSVIAVFSIWGYLFAVESTRTYWQSHFYLELLLTFLLIFMPAARRYSVDAWRGAYAGLPTTIPFWPIFLLRGQLVITYFYAGVAKLHADWLIDAVPVRWFLADPNILVPYEWLLTSGQIETLSGWLQSPYLALAISYIGAIFDLVVGFLLLARRTRIFGLILMMIFHVSNYLFLFDDIGWFPVVGVLTSLIFLDPDWPERFAGWLRRPRIARPDWKWAVAGGIVFPVVGASLGWRLAPTEPLRTDDSTPTRSTASSLSSAALGRWVAPLVLVWLVWQSLLPARHFLIPGDARFTYEGFSFSWRLKADTRHGFGHVLRLTDPSVIAPDPQARARIDWTHWPGDPVIYREVIPTQVHWPTMPELSVVMEPFLGERCVYNPYSGLMVSHPDEVARSRAISLWRELYGRDPELVEPLALSQVCDETARACRAAGLATDEATELESLRGTALKAERREGTPEEAAQAVSRIQGIVLGLLNRDDTGPIVRPIAERVFPWALYGEERRPAKFFLLVDPQVIQRQDNGRTRVARDTWRQSAATHPPRLALDVNVGADPLVVYMSELGIEVRNLLPQAFVTDVQGDRQTPPQIRWNSLLDMTPSKYMHSSCQAFYLRRYARRVADLWEAETGRRPQVRATTNVAYNGRPYQPLVDPDADLAQVPVTWFGHNSWIRDLETKRIPREALQRPPTGYKLSRRE